MALPALIRRAAPLALAALVALPASGAAAGRHPWTIPHVLRYATAEDVVGLNPHLVTQLTVSFMSSNTMAWLVKYDEHNRPIPELAAAVPSRQNGGISADGKTIVYKLRHDAKWSDGVPFTSADVKFSVDVVLNPANNEAVHTGFDQIVGVDTPDPYTVVFHLKAPYSGFYVNFFGSAGANPCVLPKHKFDSTLINQAPYNQLPIGIGPFKYASWRKAESIQLVRNDLYFGKKPKLDRVIFKIIPDRNTTLTQLRTHEIDLWAPVPAAFFDRVKELPDVHVVRQPSYLYNHIDLNLEHGALRDVVVRRALRLATDRKTIVDKIRHGVGILQETPLPPGHPFHIDVPRVPYDPAEANRILDAAGWKRGADGVRAKGSERLQFTLASGVGLPDTDALIELLRSWWTPIGVSFDVKHYPSPIFFAPAQTGGILYGGKYDITLFAWVVAPNGDLTNLFACDRIPPKGQNVPRYCNRAADAAMRTLIGSYDEQVQRRADTTVQKLLVRDVATIVTDAREDVYAYNDDLKDLRINQVTPFDQLVDADI